NRVAPLDDALDVVERLEDGRTFDRKPHGRLTASMTGPPAIGPLPAARCPQPGTSRRRVIVGPCPRGGNPERSGGEFGPEPKRWQPRRSFLDEVSRWR